MSDFVTITKDQFEAILGDSFEEVANSRSLEIIYQIPSEKEGVAVRIYSSVDKRTGESRGVGQDAIRVIFWDAVNDRPLGKGKRIYRVEGKTTIEERISQRISDFMSKAWDQQIVDFTYVEAVLKANSRSKFAQSLLEGLQKYGSLTENQLAYVLGDKSPKGYPTLEASAKKRDVNFIDDYMDYLTEDEEENHEEQSEQEGEERKEVVKDSMGTGQSKNFSEKKEIQEIDLTFLPTADYSYHQYPFEEFNPIQSEMLKYQHTDSNVVVGANTSAGKTITAEILMDACLESGKRAIYLSPLKSLTEEKYEDWSIRYPDEEITILTGDYVLSTKMKKKLGKSKIIVLTSEMMDSRTRKMKSEKNFWLKDVGLVIVDEAHILSTNRGHAVEAGLMRFTKLNPDARILLLSATMPNVDDLAEWCTVMNGKDSDIIFSNYRPVELEKHFCEYRIEYYGSGRMDYWSTQANKMGMVIDIAMSKMDEKFLVFVHDKNTGRRLVKQFKEAGEETVFHSADLNLADRKKIESSFKDRENGLRVMISTSTTAWGVNLPARNVIITGVHRGITEVDELDIIQMAGRAGRFGIDPQGDVYLVIPEMSKEVWENVFINPRNVESVLKEKEILAFHICSEVESGVIKDKHLLLKWYKRSLASYQGEDLDEYLMEMIIEDLVEMDMIKINRSGWKVTGLGRVSAWLYYSPYDIHEWYKNFNQYFQQSVVDEYVLGYCLGAIPSNQLDYLPKDLEDDYHGIMNLIEAHGFKGSLWGAFPSIVGAYLALTGDKEKNGSAVIAKRSLVYDIDRIAQALSMIDKFYSNWEKQKFFESLPLRVKYGVGEKALELVKLKGIGGARANKMVKAGISSLEDVANPDNKKALLKILKPHMVKEIQAQAKDLL